MDNIEKNLRDILIFIYAGIILCIMCAIVTLAIWMICEPFAVIYFSTAVLFAAGIAGALSTLVIGKILD